MGSTVSGTFPSRREAELAIEHLVQEYGINRSDIFVEPIGSDNSSGQSPSGADVESGHVGISADAKGASYGNALKVSVDVNSDEIVDVRTAFRKAGATETGEA
ncbi:hypothetical protein HL653_22760 [Sphingomonas sp. AP4-R1]|uniref:hypothetical protein n=1 Tax=Sphingomonas sp. AP4-R1 TaxID=2735134 RepID=UPI0014935294|nr:hypothetical protein [Sphingomonas sp. AP4-R1]QJU60183.1 hypothetical protein HL653_22760 [Sphingomonas sp. AP4-R1]